MADKKAVKKLDKKTTKKAEAIKDLPLNEQLTKKREELLAARQGLGSTLQNPHAIKKIKKEIARIMTKINDPFSKSESTPILKKEPKEAPEGGK